MYNRKGSKPTNYNRVRPTDLVFRPRNYSTNFLHRSEIARRSEPQPEPQLPEQTNADEAIVNLFLTLGIPAHIKGYQYLREAVKMVLADRDVINRITKELYPGIAKKFDTSASKVERAMRHAIEVAWSRGRLDTVNRMYGYKVFDAMDKPTNGEFISCISEKLRG